MLNKSLVWSYENFSKEGLQYSKMYKLCSVQLEEFGLCDVLHHN